MVDFARLTKLKSVRDNIDIFYGPPITQIASCLRGLMTAAPGNKFIAVDFSSIEGRVLAWLASEESKLKLYRAGEDTYKHAASSIYGLAVPHIDDLQRQVGKTCELALGFQGGVVAFQSMAKKFNLKLPDKKVEDIKVKWRDANPNIVAYWHRLEDAAIAANRTPGEKFHVGERGRHVTFMKKGSFLMCRLPSDRVIFYPYPRMATIKTPWGEPKNALTFKAEVDRHFRRRGVYGGFLAENITQATARDLLKAGMFRWEENGYPIVIHVHDELVAEVKDNGVKTLKEAEALMCIVPDWAKDLPIAAAGWEGKRYRK